MFYLYLKSVHTDKRSKVESTAVQVSLSYWKTQGGVVLSFTGCVHVKGDPLGQFSYWPLGSPKEQTMWERTARKPTDKRLAEMLATVRGQIEGKTGPAYEGLTTFLKKQEMELEG